MCDGGHVFLHLLRQGKQRKMLIAISDFGHFSLIGVSETSTTSLFIIIFILSSKNISFLKKNKEMPLFSSWHLRRHGRNRLLEELFRYNKNRNILEYKREDLQ
jgi:hypothetical protein